MRPGTNRDGYWGLPVFHFIYDVDIFHKANIIFVKLYCEEMSLQTIISFDELLNCP